jgi:hypothetical protein
MSTMDYETYYSMSRSIGEIAKYVDQTLNGVSFAQVIAVSHSMTLGDSGPEPVMFYSVLVVVCRSPDFTM